MQPLARMAGATLQNAINASQFDQRDARGFYESYFLRANHPERPLAFWIRYTVFSPKDNPAATVGQLWAIYFDGEAGSHIAVKQSIAFDASRAAFEILAVDNGHGMTRSA
jgi:hypothetical protein